MHTRFAVVLMMAASLTACGKKDGDKAAPASTPKAGDKAAGGDTAKPAPVAMGDKKLEKLGLTAQLPANAIIDEATMDMGGVQDTISYDGMSNFFISNVNDMSDNLEATQKHAEAKEWKLEDKGDGTTWKLEWTKPDLMDATQLTYNVAVRSKIGDKFYDCGTNGITEAQATELLKICTTLK